jgi:hypothetical protein
MNPQQTIKQPPNPDRFSEYELIEEGKGFKIDDGTKFYFDKY